LNMMVVELVLVGILIQLKFDIFHITKLTSKYFIPI
jgi:hypothetical protein